MKNNFTMKTFKDSYLYCNKINSNDADGSKTTRVLLDYITNAHRVDKHNDAFRGVIEDIKRRQTSSVLLSVLMDENVVLCINSAPLPRAFTVIDAYDSKDNKKPKVFIDVTGRIEFKNGYYIARANEIDKLCALLLDAMVYLLYRYYPNNLMNSTVITNAASCYVSMFTYIIDYMRIIGYAQNKNKIAYAVGLYFLNSLAGLELNDYTKSIAAKIAGVTTAQAKVYDLYIESEEMFTNFGTFLPALVQTFKLKGLDIGTFTNRWDKSFNDGSHYAIELFTCFVNLVLNAYTGCYIVKQQQIETACGSDMMIKLSNAIIRIGADCFGIRNYRESNDELYKVHSKNSQTLAESIAARSNINSKDMVVKSFNSIEAATNEAKNIIDTCKDCLLEDKINKYACDSIAEGIKTAYYHCIGMIDPKYACCYESGSLESVSQAFKKYLSDDDKFEIKKIIDTDTNQFREFLSNVDDVDKAIKKEFSQTIIEFMNIKNSL